MGPPEGNADNEDLEAGATYSPHWLTTEQTKLNIASHWKEDYRWLNTAPNLKSINKGMLAMYILESFYKYFGEIIFILAQLPALEKQQSLSASSCSQASSSELELFSAALFYIWLLERRLSYSSELSKWSISFRCAALYARTNHLRVFCNHFCYFCVIILWQLTLTGCQT